MKQLLLDLSLENIPTLENFIPGRNVELLHALNEFLATSSSGNFIYCWGLVECLASDIGVGIGLVLGKEGEGSRIKLLYKKGGLYYSKEINANAKIFEILGIKTQANKLKFLSGKDCVFRS